jgi:hypothetical protein
MMRSVPLFFSVRKTSKGFKVPIKYKYNMNEIYSNLLTNSNFKYNEIIKKNKNHILIWDRGSALILTIRSL